jgi:hypothetical protein
MSGLFYDGKRSANLVGFADVDWAGDFDSRRSTSSHDFTLARGAMYWSSKKQTSTILSSTEAEYMSLTQATKEALWLRKLLRDLGYQQLVATPFYCDNQNAIALSQNPKYHSKDEAHRSATSLHTRNSGKRRSKRDLLCYKKYSS